MPRNRFGSCTPLHHHSDLYVLRVSNLPLTAHLLLEPSFSMFRPIVYFGSKEFLLLRLHIEWSFHGARMGYFLLARKLHWLRSVITTHTVKIRVRMKLREDWRYFWNSLQNICMLFWFLPFFLRILVRPNVWQSRSIHWLCLLYIIWF